MVYPNQLTVLRIILTPVFLVLFLADEPILKQISLVVFIIAAITDWYDGWLARKFNYITNWGKFLDPLADKILTSTAFLAFAFQGVLEMWMVIAIIVRDFLITGLRMYSDYKGGSMSTSLSAKWKTFIQMAFIYYLLLIYTLQTIKPLSNNYKYIFDILTNQTFIYYAMLVVTVITLYTGVSYLYSNRKLLGKMFNAN
ncbi:MAG: CDP-diacylglycerol--glycerol-3-phosphate 3-phosphatidyltransferase [Ignavibacteriales bacterium]|nr:MAG: CDP-diacylglycerol--glycerol-3-phosphate 3-phosphatidyltransferase [Ignavibacteriales bacterium]